MSDMNIKTAYHLIRTSDTSDNQRSLDAINTIIAREDSQHQNPGLNKQRTEDGAVSQSGRKGRRRQAMEDRFIYLTVAGSALTADSFSEQIQSFYRTLVARSLKIGPPPDAAQAIVQGKIKKGMPISTLSIACLTPDKMILTANLGDSPIFLLCRQDGQPGIKKLYEIQNTTNPHELTWASQKGAYVHVRESDGHTQIDAPENIVTDDKTGQEIFAGQLCSLTRFIGPDSASSIFRTEPAIHQFALTDSKIEPLALIVGSDGILPPDGVKEAEIFKALDFYQKTKDTTQTRRPSLATFLTAYIHGIKSTDNASIVAIDFTRLPQKRQQTIVAAIADGSGGSECAELAIAQIKNWAQSLRSVQNKIPSPGRPSR